MSSSPVFEVKQHILECQHIRDYPRATIRAQEDVLYLAIKQYIPLDNPHPQDGDLTIIGAHANGFPKVPPSPESLGQDLKAAPLGNVRAVVGRPICIFKEIWYSNTQHLDRRCCTTRRQRGLE